ncbi:TetR/AcrR family transcriptional regulator C-terminal ligand-binding domain-containing protein [Streptomyces rubradiris]|uniref:TetR/AcrR family transcriptional regulator C-terminal ligand-binding domain-containing protein n=1 Tax=Streptomyces rubradiris TaxID=285531 RepID=UPI0036E922F5
MNKTTVYRRWPDKADLVTDLCLARTGRAHVLIGGALDEARGAHQAFRVERFRQSAAIVERAAELGELLPDTDARLLVEDTCGPVYYRLLNFAVRAAP